MDKKERNEEIQSRREFFKNAGRAALPILSAVVLSNMPIIAKAGETQMGCPQACRDSCAFKCEGCLNNCARSCTSCSDGCASGCHRTCYTGCNGKTNAYALR